MTSQKYPSQYADLEAKQPLSNAVKEDTKESTEPRKPNENSEQPRKPDNAAVASNQPHPLTFTSDKGASRSTWFAALLVVLIVGWMGSGFVLPSEDTDPVISREDPKPVTVAITTSTADTVTLFYRAEGQALPDRDTKMRAQASGDIAEVLVSKGQDVSAGEVIALFDRTSNIADAKRAAEALVQAQREFDNANELFKRGVATRDRVVEARATLAFTKAQVTAVEQAAGALAITAAFDGRIETLNVDEGEYISAGTEVGRL
ncbi:MAG: biotin/lipoyl-binding protein, partial [Dinoroseobacter sp.]|nr:biotin/lipoyl-binding protein [Dinoroseobacter sp.]